METKDFVLGYGAGKNSAVSEKIVEEVDAWLDEHITNPDSPPLDRSLTSPSAAAPADMVGDINDEVGGLRNTLNHKADLIYDTASGDIASFPDGADGMPVKDLTVGIEPVQSGTGDPSPTNVRPISGWTGCNISHSGADTSDPTVIPISWQSEAGTVYGGTLDVTSGVLTVDRGIVNTGSVDRIVLSASNTAGKYRIWIGESGAFEPSVNNSTVKEGLICNKYRAVSAGGSGTYGCHLGISIDTSGDLYLYDDNIQTVEAARAAEVIVCAKLATPQTYQLTPIEVTTLLGQNNIWSDTGSSTVEYPCDTKLYIDKKLAALVAALS